jgi:hypothetical protein
VSCFSINLLYIFGLSIYKNSISVLQKKWCVYMITVFVLTEFYRYESIIATLCESLDTLDEPEAKVLVNAHILVIYCIFV